ncbi:heavy-metal-associated domain-containing protein [Halomicrobium urmianum]|uniref:heavy-metal-associated domain-containing protein n=1 Tax=Halomicrobium urmianum TaxID=1586233 RepID=UPI001CD943B1|nr:heavy metal-associated domain-containing protein [Halomicrobium urmianum]
MTQTETLDVTGMSCDGCEQNVVNALESTDGVESAEADHESGTVEVVLGDDVDDETLESAVDHAGYEVVA